MLVMGEEKKPAPIFDLKDMDLLERVIPCGLLVASHGPDFAIIWANSRFIKLLGYDDFTDFYQSVKGLARNFIAKEDLAFIAEQSKIRNENPEKDFSIDYRAVTKNGDYIWVRQRSRYQELPDGTTAIFASYSDLTRIKQLKTEYAKLKSNQCAIAESSLSFIHADLKANEFITLKQTPDESRELDKKVDTPEAMFKRYRQDYTNSMMPRSSSKPSAVGVS